METNAGECVKLLLVELAAGFMCSLQEARVEPGERSSGE